MPEMGNYMNNWNSW